MEEWMVRTLPCCTEEAFDSARARPKKAIYEELEEMRRDTRRKK